MASRTLSPLPSPEFPQPYSRDTDSLHQAIEMWRELSRDARRFDEMGARLQSAILASAQALKDGGDGAEALDAYWRSIMG